MQILYLGRAPCTNETLPDFRKKYRVTQYSRVFRGLTGSQRTPRFGASQLGTMDSNMKIESYKGTTLSLYNVNIYLFYILTNLYITTN